jgi:hypothetical protein
MEADIEFEGISSTSTKHWKAGKRSTNKLENFIKGCISSLSKSY